MCSEKHTFYNPKKKKHGPLQFIDFLIFDIRFVFEENVEDNFRGIQCFDFSPLNSDKFAVALYGGLLVNCSVNLARPMGKKTDEKVFFIFANYWINYEWVLINYEICIVF